MTKHRHDRTLGTRQADNGDAFTSYVTRVLVTQLSPGNVVIMDNLYSHKAPAVRAAIEAAGAGLLFLPP